MAFDMDKIASFGLTAYWDINKGDARYVMQEDLKNKFQFYKSCYPKTIEDMYPTEPCNRRNGTLYFQGGALRATLLLPTSHFPRGQVNRWE